MEREKKIDYSKQGKANRAKGARFELKVREEFKKTNWILDKWSNNVDLEKQEVVPAKRKYNPFKKMLVVGTGFPDFIGIRHISEGEYEVIGSEEEYGLIDIEDKFEVKSEVIGIEVKMNGVLTQEEKLKCKFYLQNKIFSKIFIAKAVKKGRKIEVELIDFKEKYKKKYEEI